MFYPLCLLFKVLACLHDTEKKENTLEEIFNKSEVLIDEFGNQHELVRIVGLALPRVMFDNPVKRIPRNVKNVMVKYDDVFLATYPKTGKHVLVSIFKILLLW